MINNSFFKKLCFYDTMWKNAVQHTCISQWLSKATHTHSDKEYLLFIHCNNFCTNAPQCYITCTLPVLIMLKMENILGCVIHSK